MITLEENNEELLTLENDIFALSTECADIELEIIQCENELMRYSMAKEVVHQTVTNENHLVFSYESIEEEQKSIWTRIIEAIKRFCDKLKQFWEKIVLWIKSQVYNTDHQWYTKNQFKMKRGIENAQDTDTVRIHKYQITDPVNTIFNDIEKIQKSLGIFYNDAEQIVDMFMVPAQHKNIFQKLKERFGDGSIQSKMLSQIKEHWNEVQQSIGINDMQGTFTIINVKDTIRRKYYGEDSSSDKIEVPVTSFVKDDKIIDRFMDPAKAKTVEILCTTIQNGSSKLQADLDKLTRYLSSSENKSIEPELLKDYEDSKNGAITIIRGTLSICNIIGSSYWSIFLKIRDDVKKSIRTYLQIAKRVK